MICLLFPKALQDKPLQRAKFPKEERKKAKDMKAVCPQTQQTIAFLPWKSG